MNNLYRNTVVNGGRIEFDRSAEEGLISVFHGNRSSGPLIAQIERIPDGESTHCGTCGKALCECTDAAWKGAA